MLGSKKGLLEQIYSFSVFPAPAGINRHTGKYRRRNLRVPRASGDKPLGKDNNILVNQCSPRQRG
ncbi:hypothetical protein B2E29_02440 [Salmonella enterica subsp. enterica serovar Virchow]|nr:hypothetical protein [Salmonella enterica subsp. enterica serovar Virchow]